MFAIPHIETLTISWFYKNKPKDLNLRGCGSGTIGKQCKAYSPSKMLVPHDNVFESEVFSEIVPPFEISVECCQKIKDKNINLTNTILTEHYRTLSKDTPELNIASYKLDDIHKLADDILKKNVISSYTFSTSVMAFIFAVGAL